MVQMHFKMLLVHLSSGGINGSHLADIITSASSGNDLISHRCKIWRCNINILFKTFKLWSLLLFSSPISNKKTNAGIYKENTRKKTKTFIKDVEERGNRQQIKLSAVSIKNL